jgi:hypothetical protein
LPQLDPSFLATISPAAGQLLDLFEGDCDDCRGPFFRTDLSAASGPKH